MLIMVYIEITESILVIRCSQSCVSDNLFSIHLQIHVYMCHITELKTSNFSNFSANKV